MTTQDPNNTFVTPPGRIVGGSLSEPFDKESKTGEKYTEYAVMLALPKSEPTTAELIAQIKRLGVAAWSSDPKQLERPEFAWKMIDGESRIANTKGVVPNMREGFPGHHIITLTTRFAFQTCGENANELIDASSVRRGYWIKLAGDVVSNKRTDRPGVYLNLKAAQFVRKDTEIQTGGGVTAAQAFAAPVAPSPVVVDPAVVVAAAIAPAAPAPAHDIVTAVAGPPPVPPAAPQLVLTAKGVSAGCDPAAWMAGGEWNADNLRSNGYIQ